MAFQVEIAKIPSKLEFINSENFAPDFPARNKDTHKGSCGHTILFAGHASMLGAGYMASLAALRVGSGLVTYALPASSFKKFDARFPEIMPESVPDNNKGEFNLQGKSTVETLLQKKTVAAIGPGIGTSKETIAFIEWLLTNINLPMVLDADALNCLQNKTALLSRRSAPTIITPHPGEMARLLNIDIATLKQNRDILAAEFAQTHHVYLILKGAHSLLATPEGKIYINSTGNPGMASAGMGDALTGIVAGFLAQGISPCAAACAAIYVHGLAGDIAAEKSAHLITSDVIDLLPIAMQRSGI